MNKKEFFIGIIIGAVLFGGFSAVASGIMATLSNQPIYVDGQKIEMTAYSINDNNYIRLRDIGKAVNFGVTYDAATDSVYIDSSADYVEEIKVEEKVAVTEKILNDTDWAREDFSLQANPIIFNDNYTRGAYNAIRQTILDKDVILEDNDDKGFNPYYNYAHFYDFVNDGSTRLPYSITTRISRKYDYFCYPEPYVKNSNYGYRAVKVRESVNQFPKENFPGWKESDKVVNEFLKSIESLSAEDKIKAIGRYVCSKISYSLEDTMPYTPNVFTSDSGTNGACLNYTYAFQYVCEQAGIPCIKVTSTETKISKVGHAWCAVYINGKWYYADPTNYDISGSNMIVDASTGNISYIPFTESEIDAMYKNKQALWEITDTDFWCVDDAPELTRFSMELIVPGSTK